MNIKLKKFDISKMVKGANVYLIGAKHTGKSYLVRDILYHKRNIPVCTVISPTEGANSYFSKFVPKLFIHDEYTPQLVHGFVKRQKTVAKMIQDEIKQYGESRIDGSAILLMDDCLFDPSWKKDKNIRYIMFNGRHINVDFMVTSQDSLEAASPAFRGNMDYIFILKQPFLNQRRRLYEHFCSMVPTFDAFCKILDQCTENHECLVVNNRNISNDITDMLFWYKAESHENFRVGAPQFWQYNDQYLNEDEEEDEDNFDINGLQKRNSVPLTVKKLD